MCHSQRKLSEAKAAGKMSPGDILNRGITQYSKLGASTRGWLREWVRVSGDLMIPTHHLQLDDPEHLGGWDLLAQGRIQSEGSINT
jgi:hypothetical protein